MRSDDEASARAALSGGSSADPIYRLVARVLREAGAPVGTLLDVGCGRGGLAGALTGLFERYVGCDLVAYEGFPQAPWARFVQADLNQLPLPLEPGVADVVAAVETIEHLENPRAFMRELVRLARPGGLVVVTTPNQLSLLSKLTLVVKNEFNAFQTSAGLYPAHITALLEQDLRNIATECGLERVEVRYTDSGRLPFTRFQWPTRLGLRGRWFSDNVLLAGRKATQPR
jgi:2-polyprenyl-3-methyl-5-hydroxy-6-metoxy-1,4-benzoquinol methylase